MSNFGAPVILFTFNRPLHTQRTVEALASNEGAVETPLIIFSDGPKGKDVHGVNSVRKYLSKIGGFKTVTVHERVENFGLARNIIEGVTASINEFGNVIVLEDDMITSPHFLTYMNDALDVYRNEEAVISIHGYLPPLRVPVPETFFLPGADCWGWATWRRGWELFEADGQKLLDQLESKQLTHLFDLKGAYPYTEMLRKQIKGFNNSWAIRWHASAFVHNRYTLHPGRTLVANFGDDGSGTHLESVGNINGTLSARKIQVNHLPVEVNAEALEAVGEFYRKQAHPGMEQKLMRKMKRLKDKFFGKPLL